MSFFNWFFRTGKLQKYPCMGLRNFSAQEGTTTPLTAPQFEHLLAAVEKVTIPRMLIGLRAMDGVHAFERSCWS